MLGIPSKGSNGVSLVVVCCELVEVCEENTDESRMDSLAASAIPLVPITGENESACLLVPGWGEGGRSLTWVLV